MYKPYDLLYYIEFKWVLASVYGFKLYNTNEQMICRICKWNIM